MKEFKYDFVKRIETAKEEALERQMKNISIPSEKQAIIRFDYLLLSTDLFMALDRLILVPSCMPIDRENVRFYGYQVIEGSNLKEDTVMIF